MKNRGFEHISERAWKTGIINPGARKPELPKRATKNSAGYDIFTASGFTLEPGQDILIATGFKVYMQHDEFFMIVPRSGQGFKFYARLANSVGIIDSDYYNNSDNEGHCFVKLRNDGSKTMVVKDGDAIAQGIFQKFLLADDDDAEASRAGGLGSTD